VPEQTRPIGKVPPPPRRSARNRRRRRLPPSPSDGLEDLRGLPLFAAVVAHELRNPLSAVKIALQTLERHATLPPKDDRRLRIALREVATIERVLTDVVDWARPPEMRTEMAEASAVVEGALARVKPSADEAGVRLESDVRPGLEPQLIDAVRLADALAELVRNAVEASTSGGMVRVTVTQNEDDTLFTVTDEGSSLTEEERARAFDPFFSRRARGIGLGLSRARDIVRRHGGDVTLAPRVAGGARATIQIPRVRPG
jgi:signal transduction histidine kinase